MNGSPEIASWACPRPLQNHDRIVTGHGGGGRLTADLIRYLFLPAFGGGENTELSDAATLVSGNERLAISTDAYVVSPLFFPGGCIGSLAVNGTINDVAMAGARPLALTIAFVLEEGLELSTLDRIVKAAGDAAKVADVPIAAGDTKVVDAGRADGCYITTTGIGAVPTGVDIRPSRAAPGDAVIVSGPIGQHGVAVLSKREGLTFGTDLVSDSAPLHDLVAAMIEATPDLHVLRDPTRGGLATALCDIAETAAVGIEFEEAAVPVPPEVHAACSMFGLDPLEVANEGRLVAVVPDRQLDTVMTAMHRNQHGSNATVIGRVTETDPGLVTARTPLGARKVVEAPLGVQLPRIC